MLAASYGTISHTFLLPEGFYNYANIIVFNNALVSAE